MSRGIHSSPNDGATNDWLTPPDIINDLGPFDLDPCASIGQPWQTARTQLTVNDDGLAQPWQGFVWLNPPYGSLAKQFVTKMADHQNGIALLAARVETSWFFGHVWRSASAVRFFEGRVYYHYPVTGDRAKGNAGHGSVLVAYGQEALERLRCYSGRPGLLVELRTNN